MTQQRPQYGEIATPEEQRIAAGLPPLDDQALSVSDAPAPPDPQKRQERPASAIDRFVTIALLAYGLINVIVTALSYLDLATVMNQVMGIIGIEGEFTNYSEGRVWGMIAAGVLVIGWVVTASFAIRRLRRNRLTWWVPIVGAVATMIVTGICVTVPMMNDPAFMQFVQMSSGS